MQRRQYDLKSGGSWILVDKISIFPGKFPRNFYFLGKFIKRFDFSVQFSKTLDFPGKNCSFTATSEQIILFLFKGHHFRTYFLYMTRYNLSQPVHDPPRPTTITSSKSGGRDLNPQD